jgi:FkbM family methyltransferase
MCGPSSGIPTTAAADIPLFSATLRLAWLRFLGALGVKNFVAASGLGHDFVCHIGDIAEFPYYHRRALAPELSLCAAWLRDESNPVVFDVGANVGYFSTQLSQMLASRSPQVYAFEPVPTTFTKLVLSVQKLNLSACVHPVAAAVLDEPRPVGIKYSEQNSLFGQVIRQGANNRAGDRQAYAAGVTLDGFYSSVGALPALVKIDVEGSEAAVLRGAKGLLSRSDRPAIIFEFNPITLLECGENQLCFDELLSGYILNYVDDFQGQKLPFGSTIAHLNEIRWICNLFAVPRIEGWSDRWASAVQYARRELTN